jgi:hypothetical protein
MDSSTDKVRVKVIEKVITNCIECPYFKYVSFGEYDTRPRCEYTMRTMSCQGIDKIPVWCPLKDYKEGE